MITYKYKAMTFEGTLDKGTVEALSEFDAISKIKETHTAVLEVRPTRAFSGINLNDPLWISDKVLSVTASQFAILLRSGLPIVRVTKLVSEQSDDKLIRRILSEVVTDINAGVSLAESLQKRGKKIPVAFIETVRAGEESGTLAESFAKLSVYYEKTGKTRAKVRRAMSYPAFLAMLAVVVVIVIMNVTLPTISGIIESFGGDLPWPTLLLMGLADFFSKWWWLLLIAIVAFAVIFISYKNTENGKRKLAALALRLPILGKVNTLSAASQFAETLSTMITAGMTLPRALRVVARVVDNTAVGEAVQEAAVSLEEGKNFEESMHGKDLLPPLLVEMCAIGEETGTLNETLTTIGDYYSTEVEAATEKALGKLEPIITVVMGLVIGFIVIALYLPMFTMYGSM